MGFFFLFEESFFISFFFGFVGGEVFGLGDFFDFFFIEVGDIDFVGGGDDVVGVDFLEWDVVDFEGVGDEEDILVEGFDEDDVFVVEVIG